MKGRILLLCFLVFLAACKEEPQESPEELLERLDQLSMEAMPCHQMPDGSWMGDCDEEVLAEQEAMEEIAEEVVEYDLPSWMTAELVDVGSAEAFRISDNIGEVMLVESFAVWCPTCLKQQREMEKVDDVIHVSLDTDPNEDATLVRTHALTYGFDWKFAVSPVEVTQSLIDEFGLPVVSAPGAPTILVCEDGSSRLLKRGLKLADTLLEEIEKGCDDS